MNEEAQLARWLERMKAFFSDMKAEFNVKDTPSVRDLVIKKGKKQEEQSDELPR